MLRPNLPRCDCICWKTVITIMYRVGGLKTDMILLLYNRKYVHFNENKAHIRNKATTNMYNQNHVVNTEK